MTVHYLSLLYDHKLPCSLHDYKLHDFGKTVTPFVGFRFFTFVHHHPGLRVFLLFFFCTTRGWTGAARIIDAPRSSL